MLQFINLKTRSNVLESRFLTVVIWLSQFGYWFFFQPWLLALCRRKRIMLTRHDIKARHYIIASNHQSRLDPFLVMAALPMNLFWRLLPIRSLAHNGLFKNPVSRAIIVGGGSFPTRPCKRYIYGLEGAKQLHQIYHTLLVFPEGKRATPYSVKPRRGIAALAELDNTFIIPVNITWRRCGWLGRECSITMGKPLAAAGQSATEIMDILYRLGQNT